MREFLLGGCMMACAVAGLLFLQYYRRTRDRLFAIFGVAFWIMAVNRMGLAIFEHGTEVSTHLYVVRLASFVLILLAIADKNRKRSPPA